MDFYNKIMEVILIPAEGRGENLYWRGPCMGTLYSDYCPVEQHPDSLELTDLMLSDS